MKKILFTIGFAFSILSSFASDKQGVLDPDCVKVENSITSSETKLLKSLSKNDVTECFVLTCETICGTFEEEICDADYIEFVWDELEEEFCN